MVRRIGLRLSHARPPAAAAAAAARRYNSRGKSPSVVLVPFAGTRVRDVSMLGVRGFVGAAFWLAAALHAADSFEAAPAGPLGSLRTPLGEWTAAAGHAEIHAGHAREGRQSLKLMGGEDRQAVLTLAAPAAKPGRLGFWAERWTAKPPFAFTVEAAGPGDEFRVVHDASGVKVGGFLTRVEAAVPAGTTRLKFRVSSAAGVMLDEVELVEERPMEFVAASAEQPVVPVLVRKPVTVERSVLVRKPTMVERTVLVRKPVKEKTRHGDRVRMTLARETKKVKVDRLVVEKKPVTVQRLVVEKKKVVEKRPVVVTKPVTVTKLVVEKKKEARVVR